MAPIKRSEVDDAFWERLQQSLANARDHTRKRKRATSPQNEETAQVPGGLRFPVVQQSGSITTEEKGERVQSRTESLPVKAAPHAAKAHPPTTRASYGSPGPVAKSRAQSTIKESSDVSLRPTGAKGSGHERHILEVYAPMTDNWIEVNDRGFSQECCFPGEGIEAVSYTHLTLPTNREV